MAGTGVLGYLWDSNEICSVPLSQNLIYLYFHAGFANDLFSPLKRLREVTQAPLGMDIAYILSDDRLQSLQIN